MKHQASGIINITSKSNIFISLVTEMFFPFISICEPISNVCVFTKFNTHVCPVLV